MKLAILLLFFCLNTLISNQKDTTEYVIKSVTVEDNNYGFESTRLLPVEKSGIYSGKKTEVVNLSNIQGNIANNNSRQIFSKIAGLNIWEGDAGGLQISIGGRGLSPHRVSNFNTRQNGYDISADALGYPESYYTPPMEALDRIEIVRGAASLQYGTQFGGFLNFQLKEPERNKKTQIESRQTGGSFGLLNTFNSVNTSFNDLSLYSYIQFKRGDGWRLNSNFNQIGAHLNTKYYFNDKIDIGFEFTKMYYLTRQPGGLTDDEFRRTPSISNRSRNWFEVDWNLFSNVINFKINKNIRLNINNFGLIASRHSLGILERPDRLDIGGNRDLIKGNYNNFGNETRLFIDYALFNLPQVLLVGTRAYKGFTFQEQGLGSDNNDADFNLISENSSYRFPGSNYSFFIENMFNITPKLSLTPGLRIENIETNARGYYINNSKDLAGNIIFEETINENKRNKRSFLLMGLGLSYYFDNNCEFYSNFSENYRSINFSDIRITNPNFKIDPNLKDDSGWTYDIGFRGVYNSFINFDLTLFYIKYNGKIGEVIKTDSILFVPYRERTNVSDARTYGLESLIEFDIMQMFNNEQNFNLKYFINLSLIDARYINSKSFDIENNNVELSPNVILKTGLTYKYKSVISSFQLSYMSDQFTEASNTKTSSNAIYGLIPQYMVSDISLKYIGDFYNIETGVNNLFNKMYFTRRAAGYPGPGIIPSDGINFYLNINFNFN